MGAKDWWAGLEESSKTKPSSGSSSFFTIEEGVRGVDGRDGSTAAEVAVAGRGCGSEDADGE